MTTIAPPRVRKAPKPRPSAWSRPSVAIGAWLVVVAGGAVVVRAEIDAQVRGAFRFVARHAGEISEHAGVYLEIVPHRRLGEEGRDVERAETQGHERAKAQAA